MITNPRLAVLYVCDLRRTLHFLTTVMGLTVAVDTPHGDAQRWVEVRAPEAQTSVALAEVDPAVLRALRATTGRMSHGWFDCDDIEATCAQLRNRGAEIVVAPRATPWRPGGRWAQIADPDGNLYGLTEIGDQRQQKP
jgi:predicted enzyme related to lactoylglutathione lyase